ncbi:MAG: LysR family transcriptional regulator [Solirubrobacteraceae bacterium]
MPADFSPTGLRVLREVAQSGSFSAAARGLGYTQSAVSRQVAALEAVAGGALFERRRDGAVLTPAGARLLARAVRVLDELDAALRDAAEPDAGAGPVRLGTFATAAAGLLPGALASLPRDLVVSVREGTTPALTRALRAGTLDLAVLAQTPPFRPPDAEAPALELTTLAERELVLGVGARHPFAARRAVEVGELAGQVWVASGSGAGESLLGVWPGLAERPDVRYVVRDWWAKLQLVAAGLAITTLAPVTLDVLPDGVRAVAVRGEPQELRRLVLARMPGPLESRAAAVAHALVGAASA